MSTPICCVDAFTTEPFRGNPAAVCVLDDARPDAWMQDLAREMNLSETAFLSARAGEPAGFGLRWFTPAVEVDLCGHATLASAHVLWQTGRVPRTAILQFHTRSGLLTAASRGEWIELDFPATPARASDLPAAVIDSLGVVPRWTGRSRSDWLIEVDGEDAVRRIEADYPMLAAAGGRAAIVTSRSAIPGIDFVSRFFAPAVGVNEDPVTGSAHCALAPFWAERLGRNSLVGYQASKRGGVVKVELRGDRVGLLGQAVTIWRGELA